MSCSYVGCVTPPGAVSLCRPVPVGLDLPHPWPMWLSTVLVSLTRCWTRDPTRSARGPLQISCALRPICPATRLLASDQHLLPQPESPATRCQASLMARSEGAPFQVQSRTGPCPETTLCPARCLPFYLCPGAGAVPFWLKATAEVSNGVQAGHFRVQSQRGRWPPAMPALNASFRCLDAGPQQILYSVAHTRR